MNTDESRRRNALPNSGSYRTAMLGQPTYRSESGHGANLTPAAAVPMAPLARPSAVGTHRGGSGSMTAAPASPTLPVNREPIPEFEVPPMVQANHTDFLNLVDQLGLRPPPSAVDLEALAGALYRCSALEGQLMVAEGHPANTMFVLIVGWAQVARGMHERYEAVGTAQSGDMFGEMVIVGGDIEPFTVVAGCNCVLFAMGGAQFAHLWRLHQALALRLRNALSTQQFLRRRSHGW
ncbi:MAG: cyclic nucleotide-binding domain-containing protein [Myxococcales bacterium]|nr:cyclic nucleotide-binding domain-containing protein [Myxococcales bacterium]